MSEKSWARRRDVFFGSALLLSLSIAGGCNCPGGPGADVTPSGTAVPASTPAPTPAAGPGMLYAWANPLGGAGSPLRHADHTMVTSYAAPSACLPPSLYWYSWGSCHATGPGTTARLLGSGPANLDVARCLCEPDVESYRYAAGEPAHGGIDYYGVTGVCHQLSNRILFAATSGGPEPLTVSDAHGYWVSRFLYGTYGANPGEWTERKTRCLAAAVGAPPAPMMAAARTLTLDEDLAAMFDERFRRKYVQDALSRVRELRRSLLAEKKALDDAVTTGRIPPRRHAEQVNELLNANLARVAEGLGPSDYRTLFALAPGQPIVLVDPDIAARAEARPAP